MKSVLFIRHAKSSWDIQGLDDFFRPLSEKGINDAIKMGSYLKNIRLHPELCVCSTSHRTIATYSILNNVANWGNTKLKPSAKLYECDGEEIISVIKLIPNKYNFIAIIGHEPSFSEFMYKKSGFKLVKFPTAAVSLIVFKDLKKWSKIDNESAKLEFIISPKQLKESDVK